MKCQCWQLDRGKSNLRERSLRYLELVQKLTFRWQNFVLFKPCNTNWFSSSSIITKNLKAKLANPARYQIGCKEPKIVLVAIANTFSNPLFYCPGQCKRLKESGIVFLLSLLNFQSGCHSFTHIKGVLAGWKSNSCWKPTWIDWKVLALGPPLIRCLEMMLVNIHSRNHFETWPSQF